MIAVIEGVPGSGKSFGAVRRIKAALERGQFVGTNVELEYGWATTIARSNFFRRLLRSCDTHAASYERRTYVSGELAELMRLRLPSCGKCSNCRRDRTCRREGRGLMVLDEAHNW